jgi:hypothetical protein
MQSRKGMLKLLSLPSNQGQGGREMRYRLNVMIFVVLMLAVSNLLLLGVGSARGGTSYGSITGTIAYDEGSLNPINRGEVVILEANRGLEVARVPVVNSSFGPIQVPVGSYRLVWNTFTLETKESFPAVFFQILTPHVSPMPPL